MAERKYNIQNLKPIKTLSKEEAKKRGSKGGKKSVESRREKKLMSQIYADILADQAGIKGGGGLKAVVREILNDDDMKNNPSRVSLMKEIREATEGSKVQSETTLTINTSDEAVASVLAKHGVSKN